MTVTVTTATFRNGLVTDSHHVASLDLESNLGEISCLSLDFLCLWSMSLYDSSSTLSNSTYIEQIGFSWIGKSAQQAGSRQTVAGARTGAVEVRRAQKTLNDDVHLRATN